MIIQELTIRSTKNVTIYTTSIGFKIYRVTKKGIYEYYDPLFGISESQSSTVSNLYFSPNVHLSNKYKNKFIHIHQPPFYRIELLRNNVEDTNYIIDFGDYYETILIPHVFQSTYITNVHRSFDKLNVKTTGIGTIRFLGKNSDGYHCLSEQKGNDITYILSNEYLSFPVLVQYIYDHMVVDEVISNPINVENYITPSSPFLRQELNGSICVSWNTPYIHDTYIVAKSRIIDGKMSPWNIVGIFISGNQIFDNGNDIEPRGKYYYMVIGLSNGRYFVGNPSYIEIVSPDLFSVKPFGEAVVLTEVGEKWRHPVILNC